MSNSETISTSRSADLVTVTVAIDGTQLSSVFQLLRASVYKEVNKIPSASLIFLDGDPSSRDFELSNMAELMPGKSVVITAGYHNDEATIFKGIVIKHQIKVKGSSSLLIITCKDMAVKMTVASSSQTFHDISDSDAIDTLISKYELKAEIENTNYSHKKLVKYQCTDWDFVVTRAQACGKLCFISDGQIHIKSPSIDNESIQKLTYGANMLEFEAEMDARNQFKKVRSTSWDESKQEIVSTESDIENLPLHGNFSHSELASVIGIEDLAMKNGGNIADEMLQSWSDAKMKYQTLSKIRGRVKFQGIPEVLPDSCISLEGVGDRFSGKAWVSGVYHQIQDGNWTVDVQFGLNPEWFSETYPIHSPPASSLFPAIKGLQIGIVSQLEDPDGEDKILVKIPIINMEDEGIWCRISSLDAGENRGISFLPEINDEVIVGFLNEDPNQPVVLGALHSSAKPSPISATDDNHQKGIITRSQLKLTFNDDSKTICIESPSGKRINIDEGSDQISLEDDHGNKIIMDNNGIEFSSGKDLIIKASGELKLEGMNIEASANSQLKLEGNAGAEISSGASTVVKGSIVQIN
ncbi:type VI secretion system tip protein VgrG [Belliella kenyensis]|uniref:Type VI secretion system tip protein VgrG n=1 Tax=Belliella kenyensis TaxID=1472724 RepID=A0ABV8EMA2_9BACT|nr:type VI secretion system tip protein VgrG [Belliella kenyensis]MCH7400369.1 type VI secretion system tip protein VgrG [Belliella kenyensis]MDN3604613.1 type VI secretion system tip protein VgrG [Belliella kenyensis]